jgi:hypothetical protein
MMEKEREKVKKNFGSILVMESSRAELEKIGVRVARDLGKPEHVRTQPQPCSVALVY